VGQISDLPSPFRKITIAFGGYIHRESCALHARRSKMKSLDLLRSAIFLSLWVVRWLVRSLPGAVWKRRREEFKLLSEFPEN
jgi:hypothetical protein